jgi:hypothetical protein
MLVLNNKHTALLDRYRTLLNIILKTNKTRRRVKVQRLFQLSTATLEVIGNVNHMRCVGWLFVPSLTGIRFDPVNKRFVSCMLRQVRTRNVKSRMEHNRFLYYYSTQHTTHNLDYKIRFI